MWDDPKPGPPVRVRDERLDPTDKNENTDRSGMALYLWPDRLRWHFTFMALLLAGALTLSNAAVWDWKLPLILLGILLFLVFILPCVVYSASRISILDDLWEGWPSFLDRWFQGIPQLGPGSARSGWWHAYVPPFVVQWDSAYWSPLGSPQETILRAAVADMYRAQSESGPAIWHERAFTRWMVYWTCPVWGGYIALVLLLMPALLVDASCLPYGELRLKVAAWLWMLYGVVYVLRESAELNRWGTLEDEDLRFMPPPLYRKLQKLSAVAKRMTSGDVKAIFGLVHLVGVGLYLSIVETLFSKG